MSVLLMERPEEFPEIAEACREVFANAVTKNRASISELRATPTHHIATMEDGEKSADSHAISLRAAYILTHLDDASDDTANDVFSPQVSASEMALAY